MPTKFIAPEKTVSSVNIEVLELVVPHWEDHKQMLVKQFPKQQQLDEKIRNSIEGKFGVGKRRFSLDRVMTKLSGTSETAIAITFLVMNLSTLLKRAFSLFLRFFDLKTVFGMGFISKSYFLADNDNNKLSAFFFE